MVSLIISCSLSNLESLDCLHNWKVWFGLNSLYKLCYSMISQKNNKNFVLTFIQGAWTKETNRLWMVLHRYNAIPHIHLAVSWINPTTQIALRTENVHVITNQNSRKFICNRLHIFIYIKLYSLSSSLQFTLFSKYTHFMPQWSHWKLHLIDNCSLPC